MANEKPRYITQVSAEWLDRVSRNTNIKAGPGIKIMQDGDGIKIEVDQDQWKQWFWSAVYRRLVYATPALGLCPLSNLDSIILDPGL